MLKGLDAADLPALNALVEKPYFKRLEALTAELDKLDEQIANEPTPELDAELEKVTTQTVENFIAAADTKQKK
jgi:hypothetical protein